MKVENLLKEEEKRKGNSRYKNLSPEERERIKERARERYRQKSPEEREVYNRRNREKRKTGTSRRETLLRKKYDVINAALKKAMRENRPREELRRLGRELNRVLDQLNIVKE